MDEPGPYLKASLHCQDNEPSRDTRLEEKWERRVQCPERPLFLRSKSPDDSWHRENLEREPSSSEPNKEKKIERRKSRRKKRERREKIGRNPSIATITITKAEEGSDVPYR